MRHDNRGYADLRAITIERNYTKHAPGSVLISMGDTKVICTVTVEDRVPPFMRGSGEGWLTAEYGMLPGATHTRIRREVSKGKPSGRTSEIQRLIGRSLRAAIDLSKLGERTLMVDCDVIQADGGTRTASITGSMIALFDCISYLQREEGLEVSPIKEWISAISLGVVDGEVCLDLNYEEDSSAEVDMNLVMTESGQFIEVQGTAEGEPFSPESLQKMLSIGAEGIATLIRSVKPEGA